MSYRSDYIFLLSLFLGIIVISAITEIYNGAYLPYVKTNIFKNYQHSYEGYTSYLQPSDFTTTSAEQSLNSQITSQSIQPISMSSSKSKILSAPYNENRVLNSFSNSVGTLNCTGSGSGYSNSGGSLCLTPEQIQLLKTRGGNSTGDDSQIGSI